eukprot:10863391-Alexandrium_andersonii.AAC.1
MPQGTERQLGAHGGLVSAQSTHEAQARLLPTRQQTQSPPATIQIAVVAAPSQPFASPTGLAAHTLSISCVPTFLSFAALAIACDPVHLGYIIGHSVAVVAPFHIRHSLL